MTTIPTGGVLPTALAGLNRATNTVEKAAANIASGTIDVRDIVDLELGKTAFRANAAVARTAQELDRQLLDILA